MKTISNDKSINKFKKNISNTNTNKTNNNKKINFKNDRKINKKLKFVLKKLEEPKNLSKEEKRELALKEIFNFYSSQNFVIDNKLSSFDKIKKKSGNMSLNEYCWFCNDFKICLTKDKIFSLFNKSTSVASKIMSFQEFKLSLISMSFALNDFKIEEINRSINIFIGKKKQKNKERSRFEKYNETEMNQNKEIIQKKMEEIVDIQNKEESEIIEDFFLFLEIDDRNKYMNKMKGIYNINKINELNLPKIQKPENTFINNKTNIYSKSHAIMTYNKKENDNSGTTIKKVNIGLPFWVKDMVEKKKEDSPKKEKFIYVLSEEENDLDDESEEKNQNFPVIESSGVPLFSKKK